MNSKKGVLGSFVVTFVATIIIVLILIGFVFISSIVKIASRADTGLVVHNEEMVGIDDGIGYMENYMKLVEAKGKVQDGVSLDEAILEARYEE